MSARKPKPWAILLIAAYAIPAIAQVPPTTSVLIIDGFSNHDWKLTTHLVQHILERAGLFEVDVSTSPSTQDAEGWDRWRPRFDDFDVVVLNCNSLGNRPTWPWPVEAALERYVRGGGGLYVLHSANNAFPHWGQYNRMIGLGWRSKDDGWGLSLDAEGKITRIPPGTGSCTSHGARRDTVVNRLGDHPIHEGYPRRWKTPLLEVYTYARGPAEELTVLSYAQDAGTKTYWPIEWVVAYGKGRVYNSTFGHVWTGDKDPSSMRCIGFQTTLIRAIEWLAKRKVTWPIPEDFPTEDAIRLQPAQERQVDAAGQGDVRASDSPVSSNSKK